MLSYRRELDGLRALAVIAVIVYHANLKLFGVQLFQGGFFGVDVFFVLSGYLITGIIREQMGQGTFSFLDFYWRRAKRIVPALLTMLLATSGLAYLILLPDDLVTYAQSLQSALYFGSNHFFYGEDSYTAAASIYRPLLHTWSLSVEWQFYVAFPFIVWAINRFCPRYMFGILLALALVSLQISNLIVKVNPDMAFYLLLTRAWELILGGLVTFYNRTNIESSEKGSFALLAYQSLPIIGLFLIVHSMIFIGHEVPHPSFITLLPVLGTCLFIMFSHKGEVSNDVMSFKPIVGIGLISYSLYLWHQPVFVFFRLIKHSYFRYEQFALLFVISLLFSVFSYFVIEKTFRRKSISVAGKLYIILSIVICSLFSYLVSYNDGYPDRFETIKGFENYEIDNRKLQKDSWLLLKERNEKNPNFTNAKNKVLIVGNSHAKDLYNALEQNKEQAHDFDFLRSSLPQVRCANETISDYKNQRDKFYLSKQYIESTTIVVSTRYEKGRCSRNASEKPTSDIDGLQFLIKRAKRDSKHVVVFSNTAEFSSIDEKIVADYIYNKYVDNRYQNIEKLFNEADSLLFSKIKKEKLNVSNIVKKIANELNVTFLEKESLICNDSYCSAYTDEGYKTFYDYGHWTLDGAKFFGKRLIERGMLEDFKPDLP
jgi:peptidoglycan/LPS O-acetylase OafA/YrhL